MYSSYKDCRIQIYTYKFIWFTLKYIIQPSVFHQINTVYQCLYSTDKHLVEAKICIVINDRFPLSCDLLLTPQLTNRRWPWIFSIIIYLDIRFNFERVISGDTISGSHCLFKYNYICSDKIVQIEFPFGSRCDLNMSIFDICVHANTFVYITICSLFTDVLGCDRAQRWFFSRSRWKVVRIWAMIGPLQIHL